MHGFQGTSDLWMLRLDFSDLRIVGIAGALRCNKDGSGHDARCRSAQDGDALGFKDVGSPLCC